MTSLAEQLRQLAIPQALQQRESKKVSLLFDEDVAGTLSRDNVYDIGFDGLRELIDKDQVFSQFSENLYNINSKLFDRAVQIKDVNNKLDRKIRKFLLLLSPYLLLKPAHKALEWLIYRYHIQDFNTNDLMALAFPYHETKIFAKILQLIDLNLPSSKNFSWLDSIQKQGVHLPKLMLVNHIISDSSFLRFVCDSFLATLKEHEKYKTVEKLGTLIAFYCVTLVNTISRNTISDHHVTILLPSLISALASKSVNVKAAAYMICGQLVALNEVSSVLLQEILSHIINDENDRLKREKALLLVVIAQKQNSSIQFPADCHSKLEYLNKILDEFSSEGIYVEPLVKHLKKLGVYKSQNSEDKRDLSLVQSPSSDLLDLDFLEELKGCQEDKKESTWLRVRPRLIDKVHNNQIFKVLCKVAPPYDKLVLMLCLDRILRKDLKMSQTILKSNFGRTNPYLQEINQCLDSNKSIQDIVELFVLKQHKEYDNPVEFEPWLAAMNELKNLNKFSDSNPIWELGLKILVAALLVEFNATHALQILKFLNKLKRQRIKIRFDILNALIDYLYRQGNEPCEWYDLSSKKPEIWLRIRLLEYIFEGVYKETSSQEKYKLILDKFSKLGFLTQKNFISFISAVCGGTPFENSESMDYKISPYLQIYSLHIAWMQFKNSDASVFEVFYPERNRALCYILICLNNPSAPIRKATFKVIEVLVTLLEQHGNSDEIFFQQLLLRSEEILADHEQISVTLYYLLSPSKLVQATMNAGFVPILSRIRGILFEIATSEETPFYVTAKILSILETVNSPEIILELTSLCSRCISFSKDSITPRIIISNFWKRINEETAEVLEREEMWDLAVKCIKYPKCEELSPAVSFLNSITKEVFENLTNSRKFQLLELLIQTRSETDCSEIASAIASAIKKINIDSKIILPLIKKMTTNSSSQKHRDGKKNQSSANIIESKDWKAGVCLLELIQSKKKLQNSELLLEPLFDVLQFCFTQEEQTAFEYTKQLVLGCLLHCCQKLSFGSQDVDESSLNVELVVQCLRASPNPQTHHHALLLLSCLAAIIPNQVMHNIMAIFTFMGTSVARLDDEHSVKIVTQVVDTIVPVLMKTIDSKRQNTQKVIAEILLIFVWALKDIPQHRRKPLFLQLLMTLQPDRSLWILLLLLIENYVLHGNVSKGEALPPNLLLGLQLTLSMTPQTILENILKMIRYLNSLPTEKLTREASPEKIVQKKYFNPVSDKSDKLFDIENNAPKQLRHFAYTILTFLNSLLSSNSFVVQVTEENKDDKHLEEPFKETLALLMKYIQTAMHQYEIERDKFWKAVIHQCYEMLDKFVSLVQGEILLNVIKKLLHHSMGSLRKKALDLFNVLLQNRGQDFTETEKESLIQLTGNILEIIREIGENKEQENEILQQTALISLKLLSKLLSADNLKLFKEILVELCTIVKNKKCEGYLLGSVLLAISDQVTCLKVHSVSQLPVFLPLMLKTLSNNVQEKNPSDLGLISVTTALYRVVDVLPHFLSSYLSGILYNVCVISVSAPENSDLNKKLLLIRQKIANNVESRVLIPSVATCYEKLIKKRNFDAVGPLLTTLSSNFTASLDIVKLVSDLSKLFFNALNFRSNAESSPDEISLDDIHKVEGFVIEALVQLVLKLSESSFRPLYYQLCHWASEHPDRNITFFRLSCRLAESLKGLFVLFAGHFLQNAANLLDAVNLSKTDECYFGSSRGGELKSILLLENILKTLHLVFLYDSADTSNFLNKDKFEVLLHPLVDQLENQLGGMDALEERRKQLLTPCLAQMALATDDTLWKSLNYQILVKTKSNLPQVRIGALETIVAMATKLGEDYLTLLPETIGSWAELLEDEDERVENAMKKSIQELEDALGQPIREYFQQ